MNMVPLDPTLQGVPDSPPDMGPQGDAPAPESGPPEPEARASGQLVLEYLSVADALARRFRCRGQDADDLCQVARMGLVKAAKRYREPLGHGFLQYAVPTINGELKRYIRDQSWTVRPPRGLQETRLRLNALRPRLAQQLGHEPSPGELAAAAGIHASDVVRAQLADAAREGIPLESGEARFEPGERRRLPTAPGQEDPRYAWVEEVDGLKHALSDLSDLEKRLLTLRFIEEMSQSQIAHELGVSQMQVSRLLKRLLDRLRDRLSD